MMQMDLNFSPTLPAVLRKPLYQATVVLFCGIKISVNQRTALAVAPRLGQPRILAAPAVKASFLFLVWGPQRTILRHNRRLEMIR
jgi:hypothetical protein